MARSKTFIHFIILCARSSTEQQTTNCFFRRQKYDMILLQETHWTGELENEIRNDWGHDILFSNGTANAREQLYYLTHV